MNLTNYFKCILDSTIMVLPLVEEDEPKCYLCHMKFKNITKLREHQIATHEEFSKHEKPKPEPVQGDVTMF